MHDWIVPDWPAAGCGARAHHDTPRRRQRGACASLNLALHVGDDPAAVAENRARLRRHLPDEPLWLDQVHGVTVVRADQVAAGVPGRRVGHAAARDGVRGDDGGLPAAAAGATLRGPWWASPMPAGAGWRRA